MNMFLTLAYLFFIGSTLGWVAELLYRRFLSGANPERKWINPGFCVGPYVPLYGSGLCILYLLASIGEKNGVDTAGEKLLLFAGMALSMTAIEYIAGIVSLKFMHIRLWDYSKQWGNIQGLICPAFSVLWAAVSAVYYFCVHPYILDALDWLSRNLAFSFVIGFFFGVFTIDLVYSAIVYPSLTSSYWLRYAWDPYGYGRWSWNAGRGQAAPCGGGCPGSSRFQSAA